MSVSVTPDGRRAVSASGDKTLRVWDLESGAVPADAGRAQRCGLERERDAGWPAGGLRQLGQDAARVGPGERGSACGRWKGTAVRSERERDAGRPAGGLRES